MAPFDSRPTRLKPTTTVEFDPDSGLVLVTNDGPEFLWPITDTLTAAEARARAVDPRTSGELAPEFARAALQADIHALPGKPEGVTCEVLDDARVLIADSGGHTILRAPNRRRRECYTRYDFAPGVRTDVVELALAVGHLLEGA